MQLKMYFKRKHTFILFVLIQLSFTWIDCRRPTVPTESAEELAEEYDYIEDQKEATTDGRTKTIQDPDFETVSDPVVKPKPLPIVTTELKSLGNILEKTLIKGSEDKLPEPNNVPQDPRSRRLAHIAAKKRAKLEYYLSQRRKNKEIALKLGNIEILKSAVTVPPIVPPVPLKSGVLLKRVKLLAQNGSLDVFTLKDRKKVFKDPKTGLIKMILSKDNQVLNRRDAIDTMRGLRPDSVVKSRTIDADSTHFEDYDQQSSEEPPPAVDKSRRQSGGLLGIIDTLSGDDKEDEVSTPADSEMEVVGHGCRRTSLLGLPLVGKDCEDETTTTTTTTESVTRPPKRTRKSRRLRNRRVYKMPETERPVVTDETDPWV